MSYCALAALMFPNTWRQVPVRTEWAKNTASRLKIGNDRDVDSIYRTRTSAVFELRFICKDKVEKEEDRSIVTIETFVDSKEDQRGSRQRAQYKTIIFYYFTYYLCQLPWQIQ